MTMVHGERPEHTAPPEVFYDSTEARKYTTSTRIIQIQEELTERALELLALPEDGQPKLLLDLGCGSGLSGETITEVRQGKRITRVRFSGSENTSLRTLRWRRECRQCMGDDFVLPFHFQCICLGTGTTGLASTLALRC